MGESNNAESASIFHPTEKQTNEAVFLLEERKYGCRLNSMQLAQKANVPLDAVNCVENQIHEIEPPLRAKIAHALGISEGLLNKIVGSKPMTREEWDLFNSCLEAAGHGEVPPDCALLGYEPVYH